jgi:hypothetical protein
MTSKAAKAIAVMEHTSGVKDYDHALTIYEALGKTFGPVDDVLWFYEVQRTRRYDSMGGEEFWQLIEDTALVIDDAHKYFEELK